MAEKQSNILGGKPEGRNLDVEGRTIINKEMCAYRNYYDAFSSLHMW